MLFRAPADPPREPRRWPAVSPIEIVVVALAAAITLVLVLLPLWSRL